MRTIVIGLTLSAIALGLSPTAEAKHRPVRHCSESGDLCQSTRKVAGARRLRITLSAKYFGRFKLCVDPPRDAPPACERFSVRKVEEGFGRSVRWRKHFPDFGAGTYTVMWRHRGSRIEKRLGFHV